MADIKRLEDLASGSEPSAVDAMRYQADKMRSLLGGSSGRWVGLMGLKW